jgi:hypothetical protein
MLRAGASKKEVRKVLIGSNGLQRRDFRGIGVVCLAEVGATVPQIASLTGCGIDYCQRIVDTYLPRHTRLAESAVTLWEKAGQRDSQVVSLGLARRRHRGRRAS